ncbi:nucleotide sugar dehydrogenase [Leptospira santarosai]|uniref:Nucleotide sugar dehydrogenase n=1 Tax=Leptospira santarosai str. ZUN179 TaxID=1049985 RepID=M6UXK5_9LEPT|nr:nucleotide sugar dehydrogenase [Leptospira santarosai]EMO45759.1 nucleotide sugar dehydrogenase [Leptospira santarosai str. ZUN179]
MKIDYSTFANKAGVNFDGKSRSVICVQGLGFVGATMAVAISQARLENGDFAFNVIGVDLANSQGQRSIDSLNQGRFPISTNDEELLNAAISANKNGNLVATSDISAYTIADVVIVDINLDLGQPDADGDPTVNFESFLKAIDILGNNVPQNCLILLETTVPPGTCKKIVAPRLSECFKNRSFAPDSFLLAHSYERVMPGDQYLKSIINFWRVYSGHTEKAADECETFLKKIINTTDYPLMRLDNTTASETAKVLENSYRAMNIAFIEEWGRFAEGVGVDLFQILNAIRVRPTHNNIRQPGFGVGGYCLTKDPLFARSSAKYIFNRPDIDFPFSKEAVRVNNIMPLVSVRKLESMLNGQIRNKKVILFGVSYRPDVSDTRYSPSEIFAKDLQSKGVQLIYHDPLVDFWEEMGVTPNKMLPDTDGIDAIVFAVGHKEYRNIDFTSWLGKNRPIILDANNVLTNTQIDELKKLGHTIGAIGRGDL